MEQLKIIKTVAELDELRAYIKSKEFLAYDVETTGTDESSHIIGFSVSGDTDLGYYVALSYWDVSQQKLIDLPTKAHAAEIIVLLIGKHLIMHNAVFDCWMTDNNFKISLINYVHTDTMLLAHITNENRPCGLKELGVALFGEDSRKEQIEMKESVHKNGGVLTKDKYELYKADVDLMAKYGAKDAVLTMKVFYVLVEDLFAQKLDTFFYEEETMPLLRGPTYALNTSGLRVDPDRLATLQRTLETEIEEARAFIYREITPAVKDTYKGTSKANTFNISAPKQLSWLLFMQMKNEFNTLTKGGRELCKALNLKLPYAGPAKRDFIHAVTQNKGRIYEEAKYNPKTKKMRRPKKVADWWHYTACDKGTLKKLSTRYKWVEKLLEYKKNEKLLSTYVEGIRDGAKYNIIRPSFLQHGTTSGRYSSRRPNFQNLPRDDKRVKACIISRPDAVFVGADYSQLEPRVFASISKDDNLCGCFARGEDFYSVVGAPVFDKFDCSMIKGDKNSFAALYPKLRDDSKVFALATPYGRTAMQQSSAMGRPIDECAEMIDRYFTVYPKVKKMMLESHEEAKKNGVVYSMYGRPRRVPEAMQIPAIYGKNAKHGDLPYVARTLLNLSMNHRIQSTGASIVNRAAIRMCKELTEKFQTARLILQVHDSLIVECNKADAACVSEIMQRCMEHTVELPGVALVAEPKIGTDLSQV